MRLVSIITPTYNSEDTILRTIQSVLQQTYYHWEMIIVDDCSIDNTVKIVQQMQQEDSRIRLVELSSNSGAAIARNKGIEQAQGRYIAFLDSDDSWHKTKLTKQIAFMKQNNLALSYTAYNKVNEKGKFIQVVNVPKKVSYTDMLKYSRIGCLTAMYDTQLLGKVYMPLIRKRQDLGLWLRILKKIDFAIGFTEVLADYTVRKDSISANKLGVATYQWRLYREIEKLSLLRTCYYFCHYAMHGLLKAIMAKLVKNLNCKL